MNSMIDFISFDNLSTGEKIGFGVAVLGVIVVLLLTVKESLANSPPPDWEIQVFMGVYFVTVVAVGGVLISHYTNVVTRFIARVRR